MKVTTNTPDLLIVEHKPWVLSIVFTVLILLFVGIGLLPLGASNDPMWWLFSLMFIVIGGGLWFMALALFAKRLQFIFDRQTDRITIRRRSVLKHQETRHKLSRLKEARLEQNISENGQALHRPVLLLTSANQSETRLPLHEYYTSGKGPETLVEIVNTWIARSPDDLLRSS